MKYLALIEKARSLIAAGDIVGAESALTELADRQGDGALMEVLAQLPAKDVLAVIREYDDSRPSIINLMLTPEQFARAVVIEKQYRDLSHSHLRGMMNSVIFRDGADPMAFLQAIGDTEGGSEALADYFEEKYNRLEAFARSGVFDASEENGELLSEDDLRANAWAPPLLSQEEITDHDWMELAWLLRYQLPDLFIETLLLLRTRAQAFAAGLTESDSDGQDAGLSQSVPAALESDEESAI